MTALLFLLLSSAHATLPCEVYLSSIEGNKHTLEAVIGDQIVGRLRYTPESNEELYQELYVDGIFVHHQLRGQGISKRLFQDLVAREPEAQEMGAMLIMDNYRAFEGHKRMTFEECAARVLLTPFYKAARGVGFRKILRCIHRPGGVHVRLGK